MIKLFLCLLVVVFVTGCENKADLVILNAKMWTVDRQNSLAEAIAIQGNKIIAVGWSDEIKKYVGQQTRIIDAGGKLLLPGFNDAHLHFIGGGLSLLKVDLSGKKTEQEILEKISEKAALLPHGHWITGRGWDHTLFNEGKWPHKSVLDHAAPNHPVFVRRIDGHVGWANSRALKIAGINNDTKNPQGGEIVRLENNNDPIGILKETAMDLVQKWIPEDSQEDKYQAAINAIKLANSYGITSVQDNSDLSSVKIYRKIKDKGQLTVRISEWMDFELSSNPDSLFSQLRRFSEYCDDRFIRIGLLKGFLDGTLGSRTASFFEPYNDAPNTTGLPQYSQEELTRRICAVDSLGFQIGLHAIGAKATWMALNGFEEAIKRFGKRDSRHRVEHAQVIRPQDMQRFAELGVIASMQPTHCTSDLRWAEDRLGHERCKGAYAWKSMLEKNSHLAFGTDWPVEPLDPMRGLYSAVTRQHIESGEPEGGWFPEQRLTLADAIRSYTLEPAFAEFQENVKGSISVGKYADLVLLSQDIFSIPAEEILNTVVEMTVFDGKIVYQRK